jgi:hypothetical protein
MMLRTVVGVGADLMCVTCAHVPVAGVSGANRVVTLVAARRAAIIGRAAPAARPSAYKSRCATRQAEGMQGIRSPPIRASASTASRRPSRYRRSSKRPCSRRKVALARRRGENRKRHRCARVTYDHNSGCTRRSWRRRRSRRAATVRMAVVRDLVQIAGLNDVISMDRRSY